MRIFAELMLGDCPHHPVELLGFYKEQEETANDFEQAVHSFADHAEVKETVNHPVSAGEFHAVTNKLVRCGWRIVAIS